MQEACCDRGDHADLLIAHSRSEEGIIRFQRRPNCTLHNAAVSGCRPPVNPFAVTSCITLCGKDVRDAQPSSFLDMDRRSVKTRTPLAVFWSSVRLLGPSNGSQLTRADHLASSPAPWAPANPTKCVTGCSPARERGEREGSVLSGWKARAGKHHGSIAAEGEWCSGLGLELRLLDPQPSFPPHFSVWTFLTPLPCTSPLGTFTLHNETPTPSFEFIESLLCHSFL